MKLTSVDKWRWKMPSISNYLDATQILVDAILNTADWRHHQQSCHTSATTLAIDANHPFEVNDLGETSVKFNVGVDVDNDKFNVGVDVNNDSTVEGVTAARAAIQERFDFLSPVPDKLSSNWLVDLPSIPFFFRDPGMMMMIPGQLKWMRITHNNWFVWCGALPSFRLIKIFKFWFHGTDSNLRNRSWHILVMHFQ